MCDARWICVICDTIYFSSASVCHIFSCLFRCACPQLRPSLISARCANTLSRVLSVAFFQDEGMVDVRSRRCQEPSCTRQPSFGFEHQKPRFEQHTSTVSGLYILLRLCVRGMNISLRACRPSELFRSSYDACPPATKSWRKA